jgi:hypothetical protein
MATDMVAGGSSADAIGALAGAATDTITQSQVPAQAAPGTDSATPAEQPSGVRWNVNAELDTMTANDLQAGLADPTYGAHNLQVLKNGFMGAKYITREAQLRAQREQSQTPQQSVFMPGQFPPQQQQQPQQPAPTQQQAAAQFQTMPETERANYAAEYLATHTDPAEQNSGAFIQWFAENKLAGLVQRYAQSAQNPATEQMQQQMQQMQQYNAMMEFNRQYEDLVDKYPHAAEPGVREQLMQEIDRTGLFDVKRHYHGMFFDRYAPGGDLHKQLMASATAPGQRTQQPYLPPASTAGKPVPKVYGNHKEMVQAMLSDVDLMRKLEG